MKLRATLSLVGVLLAAACTPAQQQAAPDTSAEDAQAIRASVDQFVTAWNTSDWATIGPLLANDALLMQPDGQPRRGREAIVAAMPEGYDPAMAQQSATVDEVIMMGDYGYAYGTWTLTPTAAAGANAQGRNGKWSSLFKRSADGAWQNYRWMWNEPMAMAAGM